jgi:hypothetical protein
VRGTHGRSRYATPEAVIPCFGKLPDHGSSIPVSKDAWDVLQQDEAGSHLPNDSKGVGPEITFITFSPALSGDGVGLARESSRNEVHQASALPTVEGRYIGPDGGVVEQPVSDSGLDDLLAVFIFLHVSDTTSLYPS